MQDIAVLLAILIAGFAVGKLIHGLIVFVSRGVSSRTASRLDDLIIEYIENPLKAVTILLFVYAFTGFFPGLSFIQGLFAQYFLAIFALSVSYLLAELVGALLKWHYIEGKEKLNFDTSLLPFLRRVSKLLILLAGLSVSLGILGVNVTGILAITGVIGLVLGLASQETLANIFAGLALQLDRPASYGDYLRLISGDIVRLRKVGTRSTKLEDLYGNTVVLSNSEFAKQRIVNLSRPKGCTRFEAIIEVPLNIDVDGLQRSLLAAISEKKAEGIDAQSALFVVERVGKDFIIIHFSCTLQGDGRIVKLRDFISRRAIEFMRKQ